MAVSKYPALNRVIREIQENTGVDNIDGLIGRNTEEHVARALSKYDGNNVLEYLADLAHHEAAASPELNIPILKTDMNEVTTDHPPWHSIAHAYIGLEEIKGSHHAEEILEFWKLCRLNFKTDETPWCAGFVGGVLEKSGLRSTRSGLARSYLDWGSECEHKIGAVVVYWRISKSSGSGHVGFVAGDINNGRIPTLGGNQGDKVCIKGYPANRLLGYRWPAE